MAANKAITENELIAEAIAWMRERMPKSWVIAVREGGQADAVVEIRAPNVYTTVAVEAKRTLAPRDVSRLLGSVGRTLRILSPAIPILVVAPWLSPRTRDLLDAEGVNYLDLTGNARVQLENPALFVQTSGAERDPSPAPRLPVRVRGPKAGRLIRTMVDVRPPYGVRELAEATRLAPGYVSRLLEALDEDALIERTDRGRVQSVDIEGLLRRWSENYDVFKSNSAALFLSPAGAEPALTHLAESRAFQGVGVTGSFAAVRLAPVAGPALLCMYCSDVKLLASELALLPTDRGANVALLQPFDPVVWQRQAVRGGVAWVAPSQVAIDCLTGNGRMPAEGEAVLGWMLTNEDEWRLDSLDLLELNENR